MWIPIGAGAVVLLAIAIIMMKRMFERAMFDPLTAAAKVTSVGDSLAPVGEGDAWRVTPEVTLAHETFGATGREDILFVHGGPAYPLRQRPAGLDRLAKTHRVHTYDQRGCGRSTRPFDIAPSGSFYAQLTAVESKLGLAQQVADIERVRRLLGRDRIVLVGHSFGGLVASLYAAEFPDHVRALVLVAPASLLVMPAPHDLFALVRARMPEAHRAEYDEFMRTYFDFTGQMKLSEKELSLRFGAFRRFFALATSAPVGPNDRDVGGFATLATYASLGRRHDWRSAMSRIVAPTIVLHGADDLVPVAETRAFASAIPGANVEVLPGGSHFIVEDSPDAIERAVANVLREPSRIMDDSSLRKAIDPVSRAAT